MRVSLPVATYKHRSTQASPTRLLNCFVEALPPDARSPYILTRAPGVKYLTFTSTAIGDGPVQGMHAAHGNLYVISHGNLYRLTGALSGAGVLLGAVPSASGDYDMDSNETVLVVTTGGPEAYYYDTSGPTFGQITDADFVAYGDVSEVEFLDNYLLFVKKDSGTFFGSDLGSATAFGALSFAEAEGFPDNIVGLKSDHRQLLVFGEKTIEVWENTGVSGFPFERVPNGFIQVGCLAGRTVSRLGSSVAWVADDFTVRVLEGLAATRISTHAIEQWLRTVTVSTGRASSYQYEGHTFYVLSFDEGTRVFDLLTGEWHERQSYGQDHWAWGFATQFDTPEYGSQILVGQTSYGDGPSGIFGSNVIGYLSPDYYFDAAPVTPETEALGQIQLMEWTYQPVYAEGQRAFHHRLEMSFQVGVGLQNPDQTITQGAQTIDLGFDPEVRLWSSDDGGMTWRALPSRKLGKIGTYCTRVVWHALGSSRLRVYRAAVSDPVRVTLIDTQLEVSGGRL